jgi:hypothetical protein
MRGFLAFLFLGLVALGAGAVGYNIGVSQAVASAAATAGATVVYAGGWHAGWLLFPFGLLLAPLFFIAFFGFLAFAFGPRRRYGRGGWGGHGPGGGPMGDRWDARRQWVADQHRRLHEEEARAASSTGTAEATTPPSDGSVAG